MYKPFKLHFNFIKSKCNFGVLTGDIVQTSNHSSWDAVDIDLKLLNLPVFFCAGNHDTYNRKLYEERNGKTFYDTVIYNDLFIVLDANINNWNISGKQLDFLSNSITSHKHVNNVFVFVHQLIWWNKGNRFKNIQLNWPPYTPDSTNFWSDIEPFFHNIKKPVCIFAGDLGASNKATPFMYFNYDNISLIAGRMGGGINDNFLIVNVLEDKTISFDLIALQGDINKLGKLKEYKLP